MRFFKDAFGWGFALWLIGYVLGIVLFPFVPAYAIGWIILPIGTLITIAVLLKKIMPRTFSYLFGLGAVWTILAVVLDFLLIVKAFKPADGYYKLDVYIYYALAFALPPIVGWFTMQNPNAPAKP